MITVRNATVEDVTFIKEMMWEAVLASPGLIRSNGLTGLHREQERYWNSWPDKSYPVFVAVDASGQKLGVLSLRPYDEWRRDIETWEMGIGVAPQARRQGVGQRLIQHALDFCQQAKLPYLLLTVDPHNRTAQALYRKMGFKITSKRHGVIQMRASFTPPLPEDPAIVANRRYFTQYWSNATYYSSRRPLHHCAPYHVESKWFKQRGVKPLDFVYVIAVIKGELHLIVKYEVDKVMNYNEAKAMFPEAENLDPASDHLTAGRGTLYSFEPPIDSEVTQALRWLDKGEPKAFSSKNKGQLYGLKEITADSARLLDGFVEQFRTFN